MKGLLILIVLCTISISGYASRYEDGLKCLELMRIGEVNDPDYKKHFEQKVDNSIKKHQPSPQLLQQLNFVTKSRTNALVTIYQVNNNVPEKKSAYELYYQLCPY